MRCLAAIVLGLGLAGSAASQTLVVDHAARRLYWEQHGRRTPLAPGATVRAGPRTAVVVRHTRTPFFSYTVDAGAPVRPDSALLADFTRALRPYLADVPLLLFGAARAPAERSPDKSAGEDDGAEDERQARVQALRATLYGAAERFDSLAAAPRRLLTAATEAHPSVMEVRLRTLDALHEMASADVDAARAALWRDLAAGFSGPSSDRPGRFAASRTLSRTYYALARELAALYAAAEALGREDGYGPADSSLVAARAALARDVLADADNVYAAAFEAERLALRALSARATWEDTVAVAAGTARTVRLQVAADATAGAAPLESPLDVTVTLSRAPRVRPSLGLSILWAPAAQYDRGFAAEPVAGGAEVVSTAVRDARAQWMLSLSLAPDRLAWAGGGAAAQLHLNPTDDLGAFGAGAALTWGVVQVSAGALWTKHEALDGQRVGDVLARASDLRVRETYGGPRGFVGLSLVGMPPFLRAAD